MFDWVERNCDVVAEDGFDSIYISFFQAVKINKYFVKTGGIPPYFVNGRRARVLDEPTKKLDAGKELLLKQLDWNTPIWNVFLNS